MAGMLCHIRQFKQANDPTPHLPITRIPMKGLMIVRYPCKWHGDCIVANAGLQYSPVLQALPDRTVSSGGPDLWRGAPQDFFGRKTDGNRQDTRSVLWH